MAPKHNRHWISLITVLLCPLFMNFYSCGGSHNSGPATGFGAQIVDTNPNGASTVHNGGTIDGQWNGDLGAANGNTRTFSGSSPTFVNDGRVPASWFGSWNALDFSCPSASGFWNLPIMQNGSITVGSCSKPAFGGAFALSNPSPSTLTVTASGLSPNGGLPVLGVFDANLQASPQVTALSVAPDGTSATFPFPTAANGSALPFGHYSFSITNPGATSAAGIGLLSVASNDTSKPSPFGIDAVDFTNVYTTCSSWGGGCTTYNSSGPSPVITYSTSGQVCIPVNNCAQVGTTPVAVKAYGNTTVTATGTFTTFGIPQFTWTSTTTGPQYAMVANYDSNTVSRINILSIYTTGTMPVVNTISVGSQPVALAVKPDESKMYVANYGSGTVSEIDLASQTVSRTLSVGSSPLSLSIDPGGASLWVGGLNYISKVDLASFSVASSFPATGQVGSLAISQGHNSIVYSAVATSQNQYLMQDASTSTGLPLASYVSMTTAGTPFANGSPGYRLASVTKVSTNFNNRYAVTSTPTGFALVDLQTQTTMLSGITPSAVRGIAVDPAGQTIYITAPESNSFITVPGPPTP